MIVLKLAERKGFRFSFATVFSGLTMSSCRQFGWEAFDCRGIIASRALEPMCMFWAALGGYGSHHCSESEAAVKNSSGDLGLGLFLVQLPDGL
jgi:hypothetical protein